MDDTTREIAERLAPLLPTWWPGMRIIESGTDDDGEWVNIYRSFSDNLMISEDEPYTEYGDGHEGVQLGPILIDDGTDDLIVPDLDDPATLGVLIYNILLPGGYRVLWTPEGATIGLACIEVLGGEG